MKRKKTIKFSVLMSVSEIIFLLFLIISIALVSTLQFKGILEKSVTTGAERTVKQISFSATDYVKDVTKVIDVIKDDMSESKEETDLTCKNILKMNSSISSISIYNSNKSISKIWTREDITSFKFENNSNYCDYAKEDEYYFSPPHVQNTFKNQYPWVLTSVIKVKNSIYGEVYLSIDIFFSELSSRVDNAGIGEHGYCYIIDGNGENIYHPQQQLFATGIKEPEKKIEKDEKLISYDNNKFYIVIPIEGIDWRLVGVGFIGELTQDYSTVMAITMAVICTVAMIVAICVIVILVRKLSRPVETLVSEMKKFEKNVSDYRIKYNGEMPIREMDRLYSTFSRMVPMVQNLIEEVKSEQEELRKSELKALQNQINPHFLYNTLDSILWMCEMKKNEQAAEMISALAKLFRISISKGKEIIILKKELESAESYLKIQSVRYNHKFTYKFDVDDDVLGCRCNKTVLQPFLENALSHGYIEGEDFEIVISAIKKGEDVEICVADNGMGIPEDKLEKVRNGEYATGSGIGIGNVDKRIKMCFGEKYGIRIESEEDVGTKIFITFPYNKEGENGQQN